MYGAFLLGEESVLLGDYSFFFVEEGAEVFYFLVCWVGGYVLAAVDGAGYVYGGGASVAYFYGISTYLVVEEYANIHAEEGGYFFEVGGLNFVETNAPVQVRLAHTNIRSKLFYSTFSFFAIKFNSA